MKALANWAIANVNVENRLKAFTNYGDADPGHAQALEEALAHLRNAEDEIMKKCNCDYYKAEVAAVIAATAAIAERVLDAIRQVCQEDPDVCYEW